MRILFVDTVREIGGAQRSLLELATALADSHDVQVTAALPAGSLADAWRQAGFAVHPIPALRLHRGLRLVPEAIQFFGCVAPLRRAIRAEHPDIIHANGLTPTLLCLRAANQQPVLWHVRDLAMPEAVVRAVGGRIACAVAISESVEERLCQTFASIHRGRVRLIRNGIATQHYRPGDRQAARLAFALPTAAPLVGMLAHLSDWKRHDLFLNIAALIHAQRPDVHFVLAGRDLFGDHRHLRGQLDASIAAQNLTGLVHWVPPLDDTAALLPALDVLVHPAAAEPFGRAICEAMACARPVVAADAAGPACIVPDGLAGFLVPPGHADRFAQRTLELLNRPESAARMGEAARAYVVENFDVARVACEMQRLYAGTLTAAARARAWRNQPDDSRRGEGAPSQDDD